MLTTEVLLLPTGGVGGTETIESGSQGRSRRGGGPFSLGPNGRRTVGPRDTEIPRAHPAPGPGVGDPRFHGWDVPSTNYWKYSSLMWGPGRELLVHKRDSYTELTFTHPLCSTTLQPTVRELHYN